MTVTDEKDNLVVYQLRQRELTGLSKSPEFLMRVSDLREGGLKGPPGGILAGVLFVKPRYRFHQARLTLGCFNQAFPLFSSATLYRTRSVAPAALTATMAMMRIRRRTLRRSAIVLVYWATSTFSTTLAAVSPAAQPTNNP